MLAPPSAQGPAEGRAGERRAGATIGTNNLDNFDGGNYTECQGPASNFTSHPLPGIAEMGLYQVYVSFVDAVDRVVDRCACTRSNTHTHTRIHVYERERASV